MMSVVFIVLSAFIITNEASRILVVAPTPSLSHQIIFYPLNEEFVKRGHEVTFITTNPAYPNGNGPKNLTEIDLGPLSYDVWKREMTLNKFGKDNFVYKGIKTIVEVTPKIFEAQMQTNEVQQVIREKEFDLLILQAWFRPVLIWSHLYKVPVIKVSSLGAVFDNLETVGAPTHPLLYPVCFHRRIYNLTLWEQFTELYNHFYVEYIFNSNEDAENEMLRNNFGNVPLLSELRENIDMLFLNIDSMWDMNRPLPKSVVYFGNVHQKPAKELPEDLKSFLDSAKNGAIYMSFGTNVPPSKLPPHIINMFVKVLSELPYKVLWKWDTDELPGRTRNIKISKWFPQSDIFRHPNLKLVITQGGLQTSEEAINCGIPLVGIPFLADQWLNVENYEHHGIGKRLEIETITEKAFRDAIVSVISDERYRHNVAHLRTLRHDQPQRALRRAVWWTEHLLRHGDARHLRAPAAGLPALQSLELDLLAGVLLAFAIALVGISLAVYFIIRFMLRMFVI